MPVLFARSLASVDPIMADALAIVPWRGGTVDLEDAAIGEADAVVAYGSSHTTEAIRPRVRAGKPFLSYGAKIGFSLIGREALRAPTCMPAPCIVWRSTWPHTTSKAVWRRKPCSWNVAARCLRRRSPNCLPANWTGSSANPRSTPSEEESMAIQRLRSAQMKALMLGAGPMAAAAGSMDDAPSDDPFVVQSRSGTDWTVLYYPSIGMADSLSTPLNRTVNIVAVDHVEDALPTLRPYAQWLQTCGVALAPGPAVRRGATRRRDRHRPHICR